MLGLTTHTRKNIVRLKAKHHSRIFMCFEKVDISLRTLMTFSMITMALWYDCLTKIFITENVYHGTSFVVIGGTGDYRSNNDIIKWNHLPRHWPLVRGIHWLPVNSPHKGQWRGTLMFSLISAWTMGWVNNRDTGDLRRHRAHYDITVMRQTACTRIMKIWRNDTTFVVTGGTGGCRYDNMRWWQSLRNDDSWFSIILHRWYLKDGAILPACCKSFLQFGHLCKYVLFHRLSHWFMINFLY